METAAVPTPHRAYQGGSLLFVLKVLPGLLLQMTHMGQGGQEFY